MDADNGGLDAQNRPLKGSVNQWVRIPIALTRSRIRIRIRIKMKSWIRIHINVTRIRNNAAQTFTRRNFINIRAVDVLLPLQEGVVSLAARDQAVLPIHKLEQVRPTCKKKL